MAGSACPGSPHLCEHCACRASVSAGLAWPTSRRGDALGRPITQAELLATVVAPGAAGLLARDLFDFKRPFRAISKGKKPSDVLQLNETQMDVMYALSSCTDVNGLVGNLQQPVRDTLLSLYGIDAKATALWFKNRAKRRNHNTMPKRQDDTKASKRKDERKLPQQQCAVCSCMLPQGSGNPGPHKSARMGARGARAAPPPPAVVAPLNAAAPAPINQQLPPAGLCHQQAGTGVQGRGGADWSLGPQAAPGVVAGEAPAFPFANWQPVTTEVVPPGGSAAPAGAASTAKVQQRQLTSPMYGLHFKPFTAGQPLDSSGSFARMLKDLSEHPQEGKMAGSDVALRSYGGSIGGDSSPSTSSGGGSGGGSGGDSGGGSGSSSNRSAPACLYNPYFEMWQSSPLAEAINSLAAGSIRGDPVLDPEALRHHKHSTGLQTAFSEGSLDLVPNVVDDMFRDKTTFANQMDSYVGEVQRLQREWELQQVLQPMQQQQQLQQQQPDAYQHRSASGIALDLAVAPFVPVNGPLRLGLLRTATAPPSQPSLLGMSVDIPGLLNTLMEHDSGLALIEQLGSVVPLELQQQQGQGQPGQLGKQQEQQKQQGAGGGDSTASQASDGAPVLTRGPAAAKQPAFCSSWVHQATADTPAAAAMESVACQGAGQAGVLVTDAEVGAALQAHITLDAHAGVAAAEQAAAVQPLQPAQGSCAAANSCYTDYFSLWQQSEPAATINALATAAQTAPAHNAVPAPMGRSSWPAFDSALLPGWDSALFMGSNLSVDALSQALTQGLSFEDSPPLKSHPLHSDVLA